MSFILSLVKRSKNWFIKSSWIVRIITILVVIGMGWLVYSTFFKPKAAQTQYQTAKVQRGPLVATVSASGQVSSANNTPVVTQVTGTITKIFVKNGDQVKSGSPIATIQLDQTSMQKYIQQLSTYQSAKNSLVSAQATKSSLKNDMIIAQQNFIKNALDKGKDHDSPTYQELSSLKSAAEAKYNNQDNVITQVQTSLTNAAMSLQQVSPTINAPISGTITGLAYQEGSVIPAQAISSTSSNQVTSQNIATITTSAFPIVSVSLSEIDVPKIQVGYKATVIFDAFPDKTFTGKVFSINTTGSVSSGVTSYPTTITIDTENTNIYSNMSATANIITDSKDNVLFVPSSAVQNQNGETVVRELKNGQIQYIPVTTGISSDTSTEIVSGVNEGDEVVTAVVTASTGSTGTSSSPFGIRTGFGSGGGNRPVIRD
jgi:RND family efflux transporter MFP subunit